MYAVPVSARYYADMLGLRAIVVTWSLVFGLWPTLYAGQIRLQPDHWVSSHHRDHRLAGTVWSGDGVPSSWGELTRRITGAGFVFIGEIHPNADHHLFQAKVLDLLASQGRKPTVVWEMIPQTRQKQLDLSRLRTRDDVIALGNALDWAASGWPSWQIYQPIAQAAVRAGMPMRGAALDRKSLIAMARDGIGSLSAVQLTRLHLTRELSDQNRQSMLDVLYDGHCQMLPRDALAPMQLAQRARDGAMADAMLKADARQGAVLIAGNGHVRNDWGVPSVLKGARGSIDGLSIAQIEVEPDSSDPLAYIESMAGIRVYDFVLFTPKSQIRDHCAELKKRFERGRKK